MTYDIYRLVTGTSDADTIYSVLMEINSPNSAAAMLRMGAEIAQRGGYKLGYHDYVWVEFREAGGDRFVRVTDTMDGSELMEVTHPWMWGDR